MPEQNIIAAVATQVKIGGSELDDSVVVAWTVDQDLGQPDMCSVTLRNETHEHSNTFKLGDEVEVLAGDDKKQVFKGELIGLEPLYRASGDNVIVVRAFNKLHRLTRQRNSKTYVQQSDQQIVSAIAGEHNLNPKCGPDAGTTHEHIYQHNQTDLEFLRIRAARLGYEVWVVDRDLHFDAPKPDSDSGIKLRYGDASSAMSAGAVFLKRFAPRMSSARVLDEVTVRGWDYKKKEEIVGKATASGSKLGPKAAPSLTKDAFQKIKSFEVDHPIVDVAEAKKIAEAKLGEAAMSYITGDGECRGTPDIKPGAVITITVNPDKGDDRFNGKYMVVGATHKYGPAQVGDTGGYITSFRVTRDAEGG